MFKSESHFRLRFFSDLAVAGSGLGGALGLAACWISTSSKVDLMLLTELILTSDQFRSIFLVYVFSILSAASWFVFYCLCDFDEKVGPHHVRKGESMPIIVFAKFLPVFVGVISIAFAWSFYAK